MPVAARTLDGDPTILHSDQVEGLRQRLRGPVLTEEDPGYEEARGVWNGMIDRRPAVIARCAGAADVMDAVGFAGEHRLLLSVRGGGHNVAGNAVCEGGLVVDLSPMNGVRVAAPGGVVSTTGVAGLTLGGGLGWLRRKHGLSCDNLRSVDVVTADGERVRASEERNPDLFWGLRGGGGNFGVVTSFEFELHEVGPEVMMVAVMYPQEEAEELITAWREFMEEAPEEVSSQAVLWNVPDAEALPEEARGAPVCVLAALHSGDPAEGERILRPLRELSDPVLDMSGVMPFTAAQSSLDRFYPKGDLRYYWKSTRLDRLDDEVIDAVAARGRERPSPRSHLILWHQGGAMSRVGTSETAFGDRGAPYTLTLDSTWADPARDRENVEWTREVWDDMQRFSERGLYLNFPGMGEEGEELVRSAYGDTYGRLAEVKARWDPNNLFRMNQNIRPETETAG